jgi:hypothetical protein
VEWLLDSDPALRWQVERDLAHAPEDVWRATRARVATEGFGARLLALQDPDGQWAGGAYFPADFAFAGPETAEGAGQPWTATTWVLNTLRDWGLPAAALGDTAERLAVNSRWEYDNLPYWGGEVDCCINAWTVANGAWLGADVSSLAAWFLEHRLADGGWNCDWVEGSTVSSFHSTLNALKGLLFYESVTGGYRCHPRGAARRRGIPAATEPVQAIIERGASWALGVAVRLSIPLVLQRAERGRLLPRGVASRRSATGPAYGGGDRADPCRPAAGRHLDPGTTTPRSCLVRGRRGCR